MGGRVRWIQRSGYLITSLLLPSSTPWTGRKQHQTSRNAWGDGWDQQDQLVHAHLQILQGSGGHVGILEVDEGAETLMKDSDAFYLTKPVTVETQSLKPTAEQRGTDQQVITKAVHQTFHYCC